LVVVAVAVAVALMRVRARAVGGDKAYGGDRDGQGHFSTIN
jgi:hypothetical protein